MEIPLQLRLKKKAHKEIARLQDITVDALYKIFPKAVLHGGTAIWRCYKGNRFSEDIDVYIEKNIEKIELFFREMERNGFKVIKKRIRESSLFSKMVFEGTEIRFEAVFKKTAGIIKEYETIDGNLVNVYTFSPEDLIREKVNTYLFRRKIRDLYDIFFLARHVREPAVIKENVLKLLKEFKEPVDAAQLKVLILSGAIPTKNEIIDYLKRWVSNN
ncbi:MAG: nucleotidyl transferase AbiEii/AbiGii toxin family protein [Candidatus Aenigmatarchaeota archaeon]